MIIQNFAQLEQVYGKEQAETLRGNCGNMIYLVTTELKALEEISKMCGEVKSKKDDKTASTPLVTVTDLQKMKENEVIIMRLRMSPFKTKFTPNYAINWGKKFPKAKYPTREKLPVNTFDIKEFVKNEKKRKLLEMMNAAEEDDDTDDVPIKNMPFSPGMGRGMFPPFMGMREETPFDNRDIRDNRREEYNPLSKTDSSNEPSLNIDDLVKKIDQKIAELEEEERLEKEKNKQQEENSKVKETSNDFKVEEIHDANIEEEKHESKKEPISFDLDDDQDDDEFFDDFFDN